MHLFASIYDVSKMGAVGRFVGGWVSVVLVRDVFTSLGATFSRDVHIFA